MDRALSPRLRPSEFRDHLVPLKGWRGGNVFLVRRRVGPHWLQVSEGAGKIVIEVVRADGAPVVPPGQDLAEHARAMAREILSEAMQPQEFHSLAGRRPPLVAVWTTAAGSQADAQGVAIPICRASGGATSLRYELLERLIGTALAMEPPKPYTFGEPTVRPTAGQQTPGEPLRVPFLRADAHPSIPDWAQSFAVTLEDEFVRAHRVVASDVEKAALKCSRAILRPQWLPEDAVARLVMIDDWPPPRPGSHRSGEPRPAPLVYDVGTFRCLLHENASNVYFFTEQREAVEQPDDLKAAAQHLLAQVLAEGLAPTAPHISYEHKTGYLCASCTVPECALRDLLWDMSFWYDGAALGLCVGKRLTKSKPEGQ